jgi:NADPH2:quinone reductase
MSKAIRFHRTGGPEVLQMDEVSVGDPGPNEARVRNTAIGLNFIDTYHRSGLYPLPLPSGIGLEACAVVEAVGSAVTWLKAGDRVGYAGGPPGAYSEVRIIPADRLVKVPDGISDRQVAAMMLKGMTVQYLIRRTYRVEKGETVLFHAAAGGVGLIACQWLKALGATVIGTVGSDEKAKLAKAHGCDHTIVYTRENFVERVKEITGGKKVPVVYDSVGKDTFMGSLDCLQPRGLRPVGNGSSGGRSISTCWRRRARSTSPALAGGVHGRRGSGDQARRCSTWSSGKVKIEIDQTYAQDAAQAHRDLESRKTTGSTVLLPDTVR